MKTVLIRSRFLLLCALVALFAACTSSNKQSANEQPTRSALKKFSADPSTSAIIRGTVSITGAIPAPAKIDMSADPACGHETNVSETVVTENGHLANALVYIKDGLSDYSFDPPQTPAVLDQNGCRYRPHVLAVMAGQPVKITNSDDATHNVHPQPEKATGNREFNQSQGPKAEPIVKTFSAPEIMIPVKCNQHPWMRMYLSVLPNPFFAVTGKDGRFEIKGLPPGKYTLAVIQENMPEQTLQIEMGPKQEKTADFTFNSASIH